jgi:hypothetical protein
MWLTLRGASCEARCTGKVYGGEGWKFKLYGCKNHEAQLPGVRGKPSRSERLAPLTGGFALRFSPLRLDPWFSLDDAYCRQFSRRTPMPT